MRRQPIVAERVFELIRDSPPDPPRQIPVSALRRRLEEAAAAQAARDARPAPAGLERVIIISDDDEPDSLSSSN